MGKIWGIMVYLSHNMWRKKDTKLDFEDEAWEEILKISAEAGMNTILLDVGDGVQFGSHPELAVEGSWTRQRVHSEVKKAKAMGLDIVPKLNFSATHDFWLGEYARMISTKYYYTVCRDLIREVYELFDHPKYIHLGLDEENLGMMKDMDDKGVVLNSAFAVSAAFTFAGHLAFTMSFNADCLPAVIVGKLVAGICAVLVALLIYKKMRKDVTA